MAAIPDQENFRKIAAALAVFANSTDKVEIANANEWLQEWQHTVG
jgi:hypothetical protein